MTSPSEAARPAKRPGPDGPDQAALAVRRASSG
jgi:hypothetical protein